MKKRMILAIALMCLAASMLMPAAAFSQENPGSGSEGAEHNVTVTVAVSGTGTASADPQRACEGDVVKLSATPGEGYVFKEWLSADVEITSENTFAMPDADVSVEAVFSEVVKYVDENGIEHDCIDPAWIAQDTATWRDDVADGWYAVPQGAQLQIDARVSVRGDVRLIVTDGCKLTVPAGIHIEDGGSLTVYGQRSGTGTLVAGGSCAPGNPGIFCTYATLIVCSGNVEAYGGNQSAGIGGGWTGSRQVDLSNGGTVYVKGGTVKARGGNQGAGIGGGYACSKAGTAVITGGRVEAHGKGYEAYGIGRGAAGSATWADVTFGDGIGAWNISGAEPVLVWPNPASKAKAGAAIRLVKDVLVRPLTESDIVPASSSTNSDANNADGQITPATGDSPFAGAGIAAFGALAAFAAMMGAVAQRRRQE